MGKGITSTATRPLKAVHRKAKKLAGWFVYVLAIATSALLVGTFLADWYRDLINLLPTPWTIGLCVIAGVIMAIISLVDVLKDLWPNQPAVFSALAMPTVLSAISGGFADWITGFADWVFGLIDQWLKKAVPDGMGLGNDLIAIAFVVAVVMLAQRFNSKSGGDK
jgi:hypothetical protein